MNRKALVAMWLTILLLVATWAYPPWIAYGKAYDDDQPHHMRTWEPLFHSFSLSERSEYPHIWRIDYERLILMDAIIAGIGASLVVSLRRSK
jgi:hypothetical protein